MKDEGRRGRPLAVVRAEILASDEAKEIAKTFGVSLEEYADLVLGYVEDPAREPVLEIIDTEDADEEGVAYATPQQVHAWLQDAADGKIGQRSIAVADGFSTQSGDQLARRSLGHTRRIAAPRPGDATAEIIALPNALGSVLRDQVRGQRERALAGARRAK